ncbi:MAG TPA: CHAP domain-containing protein [Candidatus Binatus sp.]|nr:CHAP domain-containing protein [Candidatus Binatus sp.]
MSEWYQQAYRGGGPVKATFPRSLYPPDASEYGKKPSVDGPDVVAYKRALCRGGRWGDWDPDAWDDSYSNGFAHGKSGNVKDSGLAGFQRQQHLDATGWLGKKTFDNLRYALISDPDAQHYGDPLFDSVCVDLLEEAYEMFEGHEPSDGGGTLREAALGRAIGEIGNAESPSGSNNQKYGSWYGMNGVPWCAIFCTWAYENEGDSPAFVKGSRYSYVPYIVADAYAGRYGLSVTDDPIPGDLVCYDWAWDTIYDHVGMFEAWQPGSGTSFTAVEGNTSTSNNSNGGQVMRRTRNRGAQGTVFVRVKEPA